MRFLPLICLLALICPLAAHAEPPRAEKPLEVTAEQSLEWYQDKKIYVARGEAKAVHGDKTLTADLLTAHQTESAKKPAAGEAGGDIDWILAEGKVHIFDEKQQIFGDKAFYSVPEKRMRVTGQKLKYQTTYEVVTARDEMIYDDAQDIAVARGRAVAVHDKPGSERRQIEGDVLTAQFGIGPDGKKEMIRLFADGHVTVVTKNDVSRGDRAVYDLKTNAAVLTGHVKVTHGTTQLAGEAAETDFASGQSRITKGEGRGRARAMLQQTPKASGETP